MPRNVRSVLLGILVIFVLAAISLIVFTAIRVPAGKPLPNPNGYDDMLKATKLLNGDIGNGSTLDHDELAALVSTNAEALRLVRLGLGRSCCVPDSAMTNVTMLVATLANLKSLARLLAQEGRLAEMEGRSKDAAQSYLDLMYYGDQISRGGMLIQRLVGIACEALGDTPLCKLLPKLKPEELRALLPKLEQIDTGGVTWDEVKRGERRFTRYQLSQTFNPFIIVVGVWQNWRTVRTAENRHHRVVAHVRLLAVEVALRCYQSEHGQAAPSGLEQLVPTYLSRVPGDPFSGGPLIYRPQGTNWLAYSIGEDRVDNGGIRVRRGAPGTVPVGDLFFDSP